MRASAINIIIGLSLVTLPGCGDDGSAADASATPDGPAADAGEADGMPDAMSPCPGMLLFTGEYVDWDSTPEMFRGVFDAQVTEVGNPDNTVTTAPNGRAVMCLPTGRESIVDFTHPDYLDLHYTVDEAATSMGTFFLKGLSLARVDPFFGEIQVTRDPAAAQVLIAVNQAGEPALNAEIDLLAANHDGAFTDRGDGVYESGNVLVADRFVFFANVEVGAGRAGIELVPPAGMTCTGPREVEVAAGVIAATNFVCAP